MNETVRSSPSVKTLMLSPRRKHAAILSGYKKEEAKKLSPEAAAIVESLPDLTFMLSSVLMFPVKAS